MAVRLTMNKAGFQRFIDRKIDAFLSGAAMARKAARFIRIQQKKASRPGCDPALVRTISSSDTTRRGKLPESVTPAMRDT
jgi:hypothetical protein